jgi:hypothetical protein
LRKNVIDAVGLLLRFAGRSFRASRKAGAHSAEVESDSDGTVLDRAVSLRLSHFLRRTGGRHRVELSGMLGGECSALPQGQHFRTRASRERHQDEPLKSSVTWP